MKNRIIVGRTNEHFEIFFVRIVDSFQMITNVLRHFRSGEKWIVKFAEFQDLCDHLDAKTEIVVRDEFLLISDEEKLKTCICDLFQKIECHFDAIKKIFCDSKIHQKHPNLQKIHSKISHLDQPDPVLPGFSYVSSITFLDKKEAQCEVDFVQFMNLPAPFFELIDENMFFEGSKWILGMENYFYIYPKVVNFFNFLSPDEYNMFMITNLEDYEINVINKICDLIDLICDDCFTLCEIFITSNLSYGEHDEWLKKSKKIVNCVNEAQYYLKFCC